ncbi:MAG: tRNA (guanosine(46)-N7)-methyltransferase TrmB [SAR324 cluster bacterium]|nr:tRNA (guanosine(46)-N7)-methyltransferase TrmB [SAR324 cluster bacterium]
MPMLLNTSDEAFRINPYTRWLYDHPAYLLPRPTPEQLRARRAERPAGGLRVELGSGSGNFLLELAQAYPGEHVVGFELRYKRLVKSARKFEKLGLTNVWALREPAEQFPGYFGPGSVDALYINFPDPWPKASQWKKRMVNPELLERIETALKPGGCFHLKTDHSGYFLHVLHIVHRSGRWTIRFFSNDLKRNHPPGPKLESEFERMFSAQRKPVFYLCVEKSAC